MASNYVSSSDDGTVKIWEQELMYRDVKKMSRLEKFMATDGSSVIHEKRIGSGVKGDNVTFNLIYDNRNSFLASRTLIRGNENNIKTATDSVTIDEKNMGTITGTNIDRQRVAYDMPKETRTQLVRAAANAQTEEMFAEMYNDSNTTDYFYVASGSVLATATRATAKSAVTATDKLTPEKASQIKRWALSNRVSGRVPLTPVMVDGVPMLIWFISHDVGYDMRTNSTWASAVKDAMERGKSNPLFSGAVATWDGMIFYEDEYVDGQNETNAGSGSDVSSSEILLCGAQALLYGVAGTPRISTESVSHGQQMSYGYLSMFGLKKPVFAKESTDKQFGSINVLVARTAVTDITVS